ncbi:receptor-like protein EIX1 precursor [Solanum lycopersicum]|uniref:Receptor-like protein EIX1 n=1 Tax=Solanum lycopersicum TaxID=4081 RepID=EIX1_SOLLC|nr:receptor-like protein EIX1 precursor [Solanum lycopersicum]Q6JN47.2 RecName: Full=Receptor-like protein EIX1; AltName: Full=EIX receptor 1; Flags: Precursor [Solanum lycopersicum]
MDKWKYARLAQFLFTLSLLFLETSFGLGGNKTLCLDKERDALLEFKRGLTDSFDHLSTWGDEEDKQECCKWKGIECDRRTGHVTVIDLHNKFTCSAGASACFAPRLTGKLSPSLLELEYLNYLDLSVNEFERSEIPRFIGSLKRLEYLNLSASFFSGVIPIQFQNLTSLRTLDLGENNLIVKDLRWLSHLSSLEFLSLSSSNFQVNNWFQEITKVPSLKELDLSGCGLSKLVPSQADLANSSLISLSVLHLCCNEFSSSSEYSWVFNLTTSLTSIDLLYNQLSGQIDDRFGTLMYLEHLDLANNLKIEGGVPSSFGNLTRLRHLDMSNTQTVQWLPELFLRLSGSRKSLEVLGLNENSLFGSIVNATRFSSLKKLYLQKNMLNGSFMESAGQVSTLEYLDLSENQMRGALPDLALFPSLRELHLGSNQFRGRIPQGIGKLSQLRILDVSSNRLEGLPESMGQLSNLESFDASYNVLKGTITESHLSNLSSLVDLDLSFNSLALKTSFNWLPPFQLQVISLPSCNLGPSFPKWLQNQNNYTVLDISLASISDTLPSWFSSFPPDLKILNLSNNQISGRVSDLIENTYGYRVIDLSYNNFSGALPLVPTNVQIFYLHKNQFFGSISSICRSRTSPTSLDLSHNQFSGELPDCWMNMTSLAVLNLAYNNFSGEIPHSLGSLTNLKALYIRQNSLSGMLPSFSQCQGLQILDLGGNKLTGSIPGWIGTDLLNLRILSLRFNRLHGSIPSIICQLQFLQILDLSANGLSGKIPHCFNNFTLLYQDNNSGEPMEFIVQGFYGKFPRRYLYIGDLLVQWKNQESEYKNPLLYLKTIDLSSNELIGGVPKEIADMRGLKSLNLSRNELNGTVIEGIGQMRMLESLDMSRNQLSGVIPQDLANLTFLSVLDLSNNQLSGRIPSSTQLQSFDRSSYSDNAQLCGPPLQECPGYAPPSPLIDHGSNNNPQEHDEEEEFPSLEFYISMVLSFFVAFWGILGCLIVNSSWRNAYFKFLTDTTSWLDMISRVWFARLKKKLRRAR